MYVISIGNTMRSTKWNQVNPNCRWVLITGCDSGFGFLSSLYLVKKGFGVISACLTQEGVDHLTRLREEYPQLHAFLCDVTNLDQIHNLIEHVKLVADNNLWGLINNAGIVIPGCVDFLQLADYRKVMEVNFFAAVKLTQECLPLLKRSRGRIVNLSSTCGFVAMPANSPYNSSKFALEGFSDTLRRELKIWGIKVSIIEPAVMRTSISSEYYSLMKKKFLESPISIQEEYGKDTFEAFCETNEKFISRITEKPDVVVKDIFHAISSKRPKHRYRSGFFSKALFVPLHLSPSSYTDWVLNITQKPPLPQAIRSRGKYLLEVYETYPDPPNVVWSCWLDYLWKNGAELLTQPRIEKKGDENGKDCVRFIPFFKNHGIREGIISTDYPHKLNYTVMNPSWTTFPVNYHYGTVRFIPCKPNNTTIQWLVEYTPKILCRVFVPSFLRIIIKKYLKKLKSYMGNNSSQETE